MKNTLDLARVRTALVAAVALVDRLADRKVQPIDQQVLDLLGELPDGLTTRSICLLVRRRRQDVVAAIRMLARSGQITRERGRWHCTEDIADA